ncbi:protoporphyrinogen oxidase HemJ [Candidatus Berkiella cookevillensis]|uniref:Protoporphyrinogen IX oxidase n=1 Tax=Candidatus Berkiella cookevillensis TaxID=437022 RepID=A0A0Q9YEW1_9GAMM|nr:protoporphyrinogen oxidase HemJ [Candidatus Berkiella cookevillensis]MCS5709438.1 protoporphyrinogen oxidase HemJ [Candidatus Berkiella cookevillensis]
MLWVKALHIIFMVTWFAGLFYLPRLFVYHCEITKDETVHYQRFCKMEKKLFWIIMTPGALLTIGFGVWLLTLLGHEYFATQPWLHLKMTLVLALIIYHFYLLKQLLSFQAGKNTHSARFYRILNEFPSIILFAAVLLAVLKPSFS